jgi:hypothetical protein
MVIQSFISWRKGIIPKQLGESMASKRPVNGQSTGSHLFLSYSHVLTRRLSSSLFHSPRSYLISDFANLFPPSFKLQSDVGGWWPSDLAKMEGWDDCVSMLIPFEDRWREAPELELPPSPPPSTANDGDGAIGLDHID